MEDGKKAKDQEFKGRSTEQAGEAEVNYDSESEEVNSAPPAPAEETLISWNAPEFIFTHKPAGWFVGLAAFFIALIVVAALIRQWFTIGVFVIAGIAVAAVANRRPRILNYTLTNYSLEVGDKRYDYDHFTAYYETDDYGQKVIELLPNKRFAPLVSLPILPEKEDNIDGVLSSVLPKTEPRSDVIERVFRFLRFWVSAYFTEP